MSETGSEPRADLHMHSTCSDGTNTVSELVQLVKEAGLVGLSITDHDTIAAYPEALIEAKKAGLAIISGVELSCACEGETIHILGYAFDHTSPAILEATHLQRIRRLERNRKILEKLAACNMSIDESEIANANHPTYAYGRVHIAQALFKKGYVPSLLDAFKLYIGNNKPCYVEGTKWTVDEGIDLIHQAKGLAVLAHPHLIQSGSLRRNVLQRPFDGLEAYYSRSHAADNEKWAKTAQSKGLFVTGGSDFHGTVKPDIRLGCSYTPYEVFLCLKEHFDGL